MDASGGSLGYYNRGPAFLYTRRIRVVSSMLKFRMETGFGFFSSAHFSQIGVRFCSVGIFITPLSIGFRIAYLILADCLL